MGFFALIFGLLTIAGGVMGYMEAGSMMSLIAGSISGILLIVFGNAYRKGEAIGKSGILIVSAVLLVFFGIRYSNGGVFMPAGLMTALSAIQIMGLILSPRKLAGGVS
ncbi:MAG: TMEM14 family protein [Vampirovibrio sp.]|nr:TMEM14 family protein [Vampirovibrio sp.]